MLTAAIRAVIQRARSIFPALSSTNVDYIAERPFPKIRVVESKDHMKSYTSPNPKLCATIYNVEGERVGTATYAISPLFDRVYFFEININDAHRRMGYGSAMIHYVASIYQFPITTIKELHSASSFWATAKQMAAPIAHFTESLSVGDMDNEKKRWHHLKADIDQLDNLINQRLLRGETYENAVGRGLNE